jgi:8-oxo-dGTP pyrophosphatase MutT (NUDIX family)
MTFKKFYRLKLESIEDEIRSQKGEHHLGSGENSMFFGNKGAGVLVYCQNTNRFLLGLRSKFVNEPGTWGTFGGKIDNDANPKQAALRELKEETNYSGPINLIDLDPFESGSFKFFNFLGVVDEEFTPRLDWENEDAQWFSPDEFPRNLHFGLRRLIPHLGVVISRLNS